MSQIPYFYRLLILIGVFGFISAFDLAIHGSGAKRWREYSVLLFGGLCGALFGAINDTFISSQISPEYFLFGKGLQGGDGFGLRVAIIGFQAGLAPGLLASMIYLYINSRNPKNPSLPYGKLLHQFWKPLAVAVLLGTLFPLFFGDHDLTGLRQTLEIILNKDRVDSVITVWWIHLGLYTGFLVGLPWGAFEIHRKRMIFAR